ncbi:TPA: hypothetical protein ACGR6T_004749 [Klebsiella aerogenes]
MNNMNTEGLHSKKEQKQIYCPVEKKVKETITVNYFNEFNNPVAEVYIHKLNFEKNASTKEDDNSMNLQTFDCIFKWYEDERFYMTSEAVYWKTSSGSLIFLHDYPIIPTAILSEGQTKYVSVIYRVSGMIDDVYSPLYNKKLYSSAVMPLMDIAKFSATNLLNAPTHLKDGWKPPVEKAKRAEMQKLLDTLTTNLGIRKAFKETGWILDPIRKELKHVTPSDPAYIGNSKEYTSLKGEASEEFRATQICCEASELFSLLQAILMGCMQKGTFANANNLTMIIYLMGLKGHGKTTLMYLLSAFFGMPDHGASGKSSIPGMELALLARNNAAYFIDELDGLFSKDKDKTKTVDDLIGIINGGNRQKYKKGELDVTKYLSTIFATGNKNPEKFLQLDEKVEALFERMIFLSVHDKQIRTFPKGNKTIVENGVERTLPIFDLNSVVKIFSENHGWGYKKTVELLSAEPEEWADLHEKEFNRLKEDFEKSNAIDENGSYRILSFLSYTAIGIQLMREIYGEFAANQAQKAFEIYIDRLKNKKQSKSSPRAKAILLINKLLMNIAYNKKSVIWENFAFSKEHENLEGKALESEQKIFASSLNNSSNYNNAVLIVNQKKPFTFEFDFDCEIKIPQYTNNTGSVDIKIGNDIIKRDELEEACKTLGLFSTTSNGDRNKVKIVKTKRATAIDRSFFPAVEGMLKFNVNFAVLADELEAIEQEAIDEIDEFHVEEVEDIDNDDSNVINMNEKKAILEQNSISENLLKEDKKKEILDFLNVIKK